MHEVRGFASDVLISAMLAYGLPGVAAEVTADMRNSARMIARVQVAADARNLPGYCAATVGDSEYPGYVERACRYGIKVKVKTPEDCTPAKISAEVAHDRAQCTAMSREKFEQALSAHAKHREDWIKRVNAAGVDANALLAEELAGLR